MPTNEHFSLLQRLGEIVAALSEIAVAIHRVSDKLPEQRERVVLALLTSQILEPSDVSDVADESSASDILVEDPE